MDQMIESVEVIAQNTPHLETQEESLTKERQCNETRPTWKAPLLDVDRQRVKSPETWKYGNCLEIVVRVYCAALWGWDRWRNQLESEARIETLSKECRPFTSTLRMNQKGNWDTLGYLTTKEMPWGYNTRVDLASRLHSPLSWTWNGKQSNPRPNSKLTLHWE